MKIRILNFILYSYCISTEGFTVRVKTEITYDPAYDVSITRQPNIGIKYLYRIRVGSICKGGVGL